MTSVLRFLKQRPSDTQYFISLGEYQNLSVYYPDANASTNTYVSGAATGYFQVSTVKARSSAALDTSANQTLLFRDMGVTIVSSMRTFRRVQLLILDTGVSTTNTEWSGQGNTQGQGYANGVWSGPTSTEGVYGSIPASGTADSAFNVFYFETGANGLGIAQGLIRYG